MGRATSVAACERARAWAALRPDGELSTIELRMLDVHLDGCAACRRFAETVTGATRLVRETEDEAPALLFDLRLARRHRVRRLASSVARAGVAAAAISAAFVVGVAFPTGDVGGDVEATAPVVRPPSLSELTAKNDGELLRIERAGDAHALIGATRRSFGAVL